MGSNQVQEVYSALQEKTANQARLVRIKDKIHHHNKLTKVTISEAYQTTAVLSAEESIKRSCKDSEPEYKEIPLR